MMKALLLGFFVAASVAVAADRPNILWLTSEDHSPLMGCYGDKNAVTPNIDALAAKGMLFKHAWSCAPVCAAARTTIIAGLYAPSAGAEHMRSMVPLPTGKKMYPQFLREAGYYCSNNSKEDYNLTKPTTLTHLGANPIQLGANERLRPRDRFTMVANGQEHDIKIDDEGVANLPLGRSMAASGKTKSQIATELVGLYVPSIFDTVKIEVPIAERFFVETDAVWDESSGKAHYKNRAPGQPFFAIFNAQNSHESQLRKRPHEQKLDPAKVRVPEYHPDTPEVRQDWAQHYDTISEVDAIAGRHLKELAEAGLAEDTIVFYYADHGSGLPRGKRWPSDSGLHVPMVVYFPPKWAHLAPKEYAPGAKSDRLVSFVDLAPTLLSIVGIQPPSWMQGHAFAGKFQAKPQPYIYGFRGRMDERYDLVRTVTDGRYVYLRNFMPHLSQGQHVNYQFETPTTQVWRKLYDAGKTTPAQSIFWQVPKAPEELYDLQNDRDEVRNLANSPEHQAILKKLRQAQADLAKDTLDLGFLPEGEILSRSQGTTPYDMAREKGKYPFARIYATADLASSLKADAAPQLAQALADTDSAVRYWGALGLLMRGADAVKAHHAALQKAMTSDASPYVRLVAAQALAQYGAAADLQAALPVLGELAPADKNGVFVSMFALNAIGALGPKAAPLVPMLKTLPQNGPSPDSRYNSYVPRLVADLLETFGEKPAPAADAPAKAKAAKKKKK